jgi:hypothetical protein
MTDTITSQNIDLSSWDTLYCDDETGSASYYRQQLFVGHEMSFAFDSVDSVAIFRHIVSNYKLQIAWIVNLHNTKL